VSERYWRVHRDTLSELGQGFLDKEDYWARKRRKEPEARIVDACGAGAMETTYRGLRLARLESRPYLAFDRLQDGALPALELLGKTHEQILVTLRHDPANLDWQLKTLDIVRFFSAVLSSGDITDPRWKMKWGLVTLHLKHRPDRAARHLFITDTETDVRSAQELGFATVAVANGIREPSILEAAHPDRLFARTSDLLDPAALRAFRDA
jgi:phosphoglycolate phosphatase-like HAD superfamily hydrolase